MGIAVVLGGVTRNSVVQSITLTKELGAAATCQVVTCDPTGAYVPPIGTPIEIYDATPTIIYAGSAQDVEVTRREHTAVNVCTITGTDLNHATTRRLAGEYQWTNKTVLQIVTDIVGNSLVGDLTDITLVETGPTIASFRIRYPTVAEAFDSLATLAGMVWYIDEQNRLVFKTPTASSAPFDITDGTNLTALTIRGSREDYCNFAVAAVPERLRPEDTESFVGDGSNQIFELDYPVAQEPTITLNSVAQTVGIISVDTGRDWYWAEGSTEIRQDSGGTPITSGDTLEVTYVGTESTFISSQNAGQIAARAAAEDNSGVYAKFIEIEGRRTAADAQATLDAYVAKFDELSYIAIIETNDYLEPDSLTIQTGEMMTISRAGYGTTGDFMVRKISITHLDVHDDAPYQWAVRIEAVKGPALRQFAELIGAGGTAATAASAAVADLGDFQLEFI
jgi:hypothetical protein